MNEILPSKLETKTGLKDTKDVMKGKDLIMVYFSASWCPPCQKFTPILIDFYKQSCLGKKVECIYVSSDRDLDSYNAYYKKMPWLSIQATDMAGKQSLADLFSVQGIPHLVVLDKDGKFVTEHTKEEIVKVAGNKVGGDELIESWKSKEAKPLNEVKFAGKGPLLKRIIMFFLTNPMYMLGTYYLIKKGLEHLQALGEDGEDAVNVPEL